MLFMKKCQAQGLRPKLKIGIKKFFISGAISPKL